MNAGTWHQDGLKRAEAAALVQAAVASRWAGLRGFSFILAALFYFLRGRIPAGGFIALAALIVFMVAVGLDFRARARIAREQRRSEHHRTGLLRLSGGWPGHGVSGDLAMPQAHAFAGQLDLFGQGSLFERLCIARTRPGQDRLASWLLQPASVEEAIARQDAVDALVKDAAGREERALLGPDKLEALDPHRLETWLSAPALGRMSLAWLIAWILGIGLPLSIVMAFRGVWPWSAVLFGLLLMGLQYAWLGRELTSRQGRWVEAASALALLRPFLAEARGRPTPSPWLESCAKRLAEGQPIRSLRSLDRLLVWLDSCRNLIFAPFAFLLNLPVLLGLGLEAWRQREREAIPHWLDALADFEAIDSFAAHAFEEGEFACRPRWREAAGFEARQLRHPLLSAEEGVANDIGLSSEHPLMVISGSNMSGKSTLLRSVGCALILARAGARITAEDLELSSLGLGASIATHDDLLAGASRFWAEVEQLKRVASAAELGPPLIFLIDEIFSGTNSRDRAEGARLLLERLLGDGAMGLVSTHDLALTQLAGAHPGALNAHFEDQVEGDALRFDYLLREGVATRSNALALMRAIGLIPKE